MKAIILAAGRGSRMKNMTDDRPKCLVQLHGKTLIDYQITALYEAGIDEIGVVTGYKRELLANLGLTEFYNPRWAETNMVLSLVCAKKWLQQESCIVSYSDIFYSTKAVKSLMSCDGALSITYDVNWLELWTRRFGDPLLDAETFRINQDKTLAEIGNKPKFIEEVIGQYMGLLRFDPQSWAEVTRILSGMKPVEADKIHMTGMLQQIIDAGRISINTAAYDGVWGEIDSLTDLKMYRKDANLFDINSGFK
jgi:choline kinase